MHGSTDGRRRRAVTLALALATPVVAVAGCTSDTAMSSPGPDGGGGAPDLAGAGDAGGGGGGNLVATLASTGGDFVRPFDSVPDGKGATFYFVARSGAGVPGVFAVPAAGGTATAIAMGGPLSSPFAIAIGGDDKTVYVADPAAGADPAAADTAPDAPGAIYAVAAGGGTLTALGGTLGYSPRGLEVATEGTSDVVYFTGVDPADGQPGLFKVAAAGGTVSAVVKGAPLREPSGVAVGKSGTIYVTDHLGAGALGVVFKVTGGSATALASGLRFGFPAGIAVTRDESRVLVSGMDDDTRTDLVYLIDPATGAVASSSMGVGDNTDAGGLHRARSADVLSWCGITVGDRGSVYQVVLK